MQFVPYKIDLHIHTALSPCAEKEMTPPRIIHAAKARGLKLIAITDHNTAENVGAAMEAAGNYGIIVIPGMEVQTREEVHLVCLFPSLEACSAWQEKVYQSLPPLPNRPEIFGTQPVMDSTGQTLRELDRLLLQSCEMSVETVAAGVAALGGICIPAHVDRPSYSLIAVLGFIPDNLPIQAVEISRLTTVQEAVALMPSLQKFKLVSSSDAHCLQDVGNNPTTFFCCGPPTFAELRKALVETTDRKVLAKVKDLSMHIIDIVQNSLEAGATKVTLLISEDTVSDCFTIEITDDGHGMDQEQLVKAVDPFFTTRTTRRVGLGLSLLKAAAERCEGSMVIDSAPGKGTSVKATFRHSHIDRAPLGNIIDTVVNFVVSNPNSGFYFKHRINGQEIIFDAGELREQLVDVPLDNPAVINWIKNYLTESYKELSTES